MILLPITGRNVSLNQLVVLLKSCHTIQNYEQVTFQGRGSQVMVYPLGHLNPLVGGGYPFGLKNTLTSFPYELHYRDFGVFYIWKVYYVDCDKPGGGLLGTLTGEGGR